MNENNLIAWKPSAQAAPFSQFTDLTSAAPTGLPEICLHPGQSHVTGSATILKMILGSCAGVFLFDLKLGIGGATHYMLPTHREGPPSPRFGDVAIAQLLERFQAMGSRCWNIQAKVFGGGSMLQALENLHGSRIGQIGKRNIELAFELLEQESIAIVEKDVLGSHGRKVSMVSSTGAVALKIVSSTDGN